MACFNTHETISIRFKLIKIRVSLIKVVRCQLYYAILIFVGINPDHLSYFHFVGRILGIAVFHGHCLDAGFTLPFYKQLLNKPITLSDIEGVDPELHRSLTWML